MGVFDEAYDVVGNVESLVSDRIADAVAFSTTLTNQALATLGALAGLNFNIGAAVPSVPVLNTNVSLILDLPAITPTSFGTITAGTFAFPTLLEIPTISEIDIPEFDPSIQTLSIPQPPALLGPGTEPDRPTLATIEYPATPTFTLPEAPTLTELEIPAFTFPTLPSFTADEPEFEGSALSTVLQWSEPEYLTEILDEVLVQIRALWSGTSGLPAAVEQAMRERASSREDLEINRAADAVAEDFSSRGFTMPSGVQAAREDAIRQDGMIKKLAMNRELTVEFAKFQIENIRFGVEQAIAAENLFVNIFNNAQTRVFEAAKFQVESLISIYNAQVALFNARQNAYQVAAQVYKIQIDARLAELEVFKAQVEAEVAKGQLNEQRVRAYLAQIQAVSASVDVYKAQMEGARIQSEAIRNEIEVYKTEVEVFATRLSADKNRVDMYSAQVSAEGVKGNIIDAEARAYASVIQGRAIQVELEAKRADVFINTNTSLLNGFRAQLEHDSNRMQASIATISAAAQAYTADTQRHTAEIQGATAKAELELQSKVSELQTTVQLFQTTSQVALAQQSNAIQQAGLAANALSSAGQIGATLAAGATAGVHVGATLNGGGSVTAAGSASSSTSTSTSTATTYNHHYEGT